MSAQDRQFSRAETLDALRLFRSENVGPITYRRLIERYGTPAQALDALPELARRGGKRSVKVCPKGAAERELEALERAGGRMVALGEAGYPGLLATVEDAPPVLSVLGHVELLKRQAVGMVGARNASINGTKIARKLAAELGRAGFVVASGMARGIDAAAHEGALSTGTVAVLGGGVDVIYPRENEGLYRRLIEAGAVVSEMPMGETPQARHFPRRNRVISGMSYGVVVVEATARSGSLITARFAGEQGREVFAVPGSPLDPRSEGPNKLLRQGATLCERGDDVLEALRPMLAKPLAERERPDFRGARPVDPDPRALDDARPRVLSAMGPSAVGVDEIIRQCDVSPPTVSLILLELELAGRLERHPGNRVSLIG